MSEFSWIRIFAWKPVRVQSGGWTWLADVDAAIVKLPRAKGYREIYRNIPMSPRKARILTVLSVGAALVGGYAYTWGISHTVMQ